jgi:hypothetical protein
MKTGQHWLRIKQAVSMKGNTHFDSELNDAYYIMNAANQSMKGYAYILSSLQRGSGSI